MELSPVIISIKTAVVASIITIFLGIALARLVFSIKNNNLKVLIDAILTIPLVLPPTVVGFLLLLLFGVRRPIGIFFIQVFNWRIAFSWSATVIAAIVISFPLMYRSARTAFEQIDSNIVNSAKTLGISNRKIFFKLQLPLAINGLMSGAALAFARGLGEFGATIMFAGNIAGKTQTLPIAIYSKVTANNFDEAYKYVLILTIICFMVVIIINFLTIKKNDY